MIFVFDTGVKGAAISTSFAYILDFLMAFGMQLYHPVLRKTLVRFEISNLPVR